MNIWSNVYQFNPLAAHLLVVLVNEVKNQILSASHVLAVVSLEVNLSNLTDLVACDS